MAGLLCLGGCSLFEAPAQLRGNKVDPDALKELVVGTSTEADARSLLGSPTAHATFDDNTWLYISEVTRTRIGRTPGVEHQDVVSLTFNDQGVLSKVTKLNHSDSLPVAIVQKTTPAPGTNTS
ncbi:MAG: outer membrane protein assembly factor BamE, partial [Rhodospirillales bacterium]|nr:outer membrane protein assembly factor BamE [Rhodospirillales bacterium]